MTLSFRLIVLKSYRLIEIFLLFALAFPARTRKKSEKILQKLIFFVLLHQLEKSELRNAEDS